MGTTDMKPEEVAGMNADEVAKWASESASRPVASVTSPPIDRCGVTWSFYTSDESADPPNALRVVVGWPGERSQDMLASDIVPKDELAVLRVVQCRALLAARTRVGAG